MKKKGIVFAAVERGGKMRATVMPDSSAKSHQQFLWQNVSTKGTRLMTDSARHYELKIPKEKVEETINRNLKQTAQGILNAPVPSPIQIVKK